MRRKLLLVATICALTVGVTSPPAGAYQSLGATDTPAAETVHTDSLAPAGSIDATERDILAGLLFGIGDFAAEIGNEVPAIAGLSKAEYQAQAEETLDGFISAHSVELKPVLADIRSGDINRVEVGLDGLARLYLGYVESQVSAEEYALLQQGQEYLPACGLAWACVVTVVIHNTVAITSAAAVAISAALALAITVWCGVTDKDCQIERAPSRAEAEYFRAEIARAARA